MSDPLTDLPALHSRLLELSQANARLVAGFRASCTIQSSLESTIILLKDKISFLHIQRDELLRQLSLSQYGKQQQ